MKRNIKRTRWNEFFCRLIPVRVKLQGLWAGKETIEECIVKYRGETLEKSLSVGPLSLTSVLPSVEKEYCALDMWMTCRAAVVSRTCFRLPHHLTGTVERLTLYVSFYALNTGDNEEVTIFFLNCLYKYFVLYKCFGKY
jgi:hypothetical protein